MRSKRKSVKSIWVWFFCLSLAFCLSCESKERYAGKYVASGKEEISLDLKPSGEGSWALGDKEVAFSWYIKGGDLRVNTKEGGVLVGKIEGNTIKVTLPARGEISFIKTQ